MYCGFCGRKAIRKTEEVVYVDAKGPYMYYKHTWKCPKYHPLFFHKHLYVNEGSSEVGYRYDPETGEYNW